MQVRHNTSLLEEAVGQVVRRAAIPLLQAEAAAEEKALRAQAFRRMATGAAIALAAVGIGIGVFFGLHQPQITRPIEVAEQTPPPTASPTSSQVPIPTAPATDAASQPENDEIVTVQFDKFTSKTVTMFGTNWVVSAGHHFKTETDPMWSYAWCYTKRDVEGVSVNIELAHRSSPSDDIVAPLASEQTLAQASLSKAAALALAMECAWMDQREDPIGKFVSPAGTTNPFSKDPEISTSNGILTYQGIIGPTFAYLLRMNNFDRLRISSVGGDLDQALAAGDYLRSRGKPVEAFGDCLSACVYVLAGGSERSVSPGSKIGVHQFRSNEVADASLAMELAQSKSSEIIQYLQKMDIDPELFHAMARVPAEEMSFLETEQLVEWKLISTPRLSAQEWFEALDDEAKLIIQSDLILLGHYRGLMDGAFGEATLSALSAYQKGLGLTAGLGLSEKEQEGLREDAKSAFTEYRFSPTADREAGSSLTLPKAIFDKGRPAAQGTRYFAQSGGITLDTVSRSAKGETLAQLYAIVAKPTDVKTVSYSAMSGSQRFVVTGIDKGREFYVMFVAAGDQNVGFQLTWDPQKSDQANVVAMFIASNFFPLQSSKPKERSARWELLDQAYGMP